MFLKILSIILGVLVCTSTVFAASTTFDSNALATETPLILVGKSGQSADLLDAFSSTSTKLFSVDQSGNVIVLGNLNATGLTTLASLNVAGPVTVAGLTVTGTTSVVGLTASGQIQATAGGQTGFTPPIVGIGSGVRFQYMRNVDLGVCQFSGGCVEEDIVTLSPAFTSASSYMCLANQDVASPSDWNNVVTSFANQSGSQTVVDFSTAFAAIEVFVDIFCIGS
jgi:hypothetical protein